MNQPAQAIRSRNRWSGCIGVVLAVWCSGLGLEQAQATGEPRAKGTQIPVIINLYPGSGRTEAGAREAVRQANAILRQACMRLVVVEVNDPPGAGNGDDGSGGGTAGDGDFTGAERRKLRTFGGQELQMLPNKRGIKISFGDTPVDGSATPGVSVHRDPTIIVKNRDTANNTAQTIAHEFGHVMTLGAKHTINDTTTADQGGHCPDVAGGAGNGNIMAPSNRRNGTNLTEDQIEEMNRRRFVHGKCSVQFRTAFPAERCEQQHGGGTDARGDQGGGAAGPLLSDIFDIHQVWMAALFDDPDIEVQISVAGAFPENEDINAVYTLGIDIDDDDLTGIPHGGLLGVDRIVRLTVSGSIGDGTLEVSGEVENTNDNTVAPLPEDPQAVVEGEFPDLDGEAVPEMTSLLFKAPKDLLGLAPTSNPPDIVEVVATAGTDLLVLDFLQLEFDLERWLKDPELQTFGTGIPQPGAPYPIAISGLLPFDTFELSLDETVVLTDVLDGQGNFQGDFIFPLEVPANEFHFLTAQDSTGEFAYTITCPEFETCPQDLTGDGQVNAADLALLLGGWGNNPGHPADFNGDDLVNAADLALLLGAWGPCPEPVCGDGTVEAAEQCDPPDNKLCGPDCLLIPFCGNGVRDPGEQCDPPDGVTCDDNCQEIPSGPCPGSGDCCAPNGTPGCEDPFCCEQVCGLDPFCCDTAWDKICAGHAQSLCPRLCPQGSCPGPGDCCVPNGSPGCNDFNCCNQVCAVDPFCCAVDWADNCVSLAQGICPGLCAAQSDCCVAHPSPGCDDPECALLVCAIQPLCCDLSWQPTCAGLALELCEACAP